MSKQNIFLFLILGMFMISFSSALEFDNVKSYNEELKVVTITNAYGLGEVIGQARLTTPQNVLVGAGYQKVAQFDIWAYGDYNDAIKQFTFTDMKKKEKINREFDMKMLTYEDVIVEDYYYDCYDKVSINGTIEDKCDKIINGSHVEQQEVWTKVTPADLKKSEFVTIGIFTDVQVGDYVDWIPTIYGVEVEEWATWTADLNVNISSYYKFDTDADDSLGINNGTASGATLTTGDGGLINEAYEFDFGDTDYVDITGVSTSGDFSISLWMYSDTALVAAGQYVIDSETGRFSIGGSINNGNWYIYDGSTFTTFSDTDLLNEWNHVVVTKSGTTMKVYLNDSEIDSWTSSVNLGGTTKIGSRYNGVSSFGGKIDEVGFWDRALTSGEITQLYNEGNGISYTTEFGTAPNATLLSPINNSNITIKTVNLVGNADDVNLTNVTLYLDGVANETDTSGINGNYTFIKTVPRGIHNWSFLVCNNQSLCNQTDTWFFNYTDIVPEVILISPENNSNLSSGSISFILNATDNNGMENVTLYINGVVNETDTSGTNGTYNFNKVVDEGYYNWSAIACDDSGLCKQSDTWFFNYTQPPIFVQLNNPIDNYFSPLPFINMSCTGYSSDGVTRLNLTLDGSINETLTNSTPSQNLTINKNVTFTEGVHTWKCSVEKYDIATTSSTRTLTIDQTPPGVTITFPTNTTYNYNISIMNYSTIELNPDRCWYSTDGGTINSTDYAYGTGFDGIVSIEGLNTWTTYCNDSAGNLGSDSVSFTRDTLLMTLNSPTDNATTLINQISFNVTANSTIGDSLNNISLWTNITGSWAITETKIVAYTGEDNISYDTTLYETSLDPWINLKTYNALGNNNISSVYFEFSQDDVGRDAFVRFLYHYTNGTTLITPTRTVSSTSFTPFVETAFLREHLIDSITLQGGDDGQGGLNVKNINISSFQNVSFSNIIFNQTLNDGIIWNAEVCDLNGYCSFADNNFTLHVDQTLPEIIIESPVGTLGSGVVGNPETLNFTATDINIDTCWYEYNGVNTTIEGCVSGVKNSTTFILVSGELSLTVWVNDTMGLLSSNTTTWDYFINDEGVSFDQPIIEGVPNTIIQTISISGGALLQDAYLDYNGTNYSTTLVFVGGQYLISTTAPAPDVSVASNITFRFVVEVSGTSYSLRENTQLVLPLNFSECGGGDVLINISLYDEGTRNGINGTIEVNADLISKTTLTTVESISFEVDSQNVLICLDPINSTEFFFLDTEIRYEADDYAAEFYYIQRADLSVYPIVVPLFDLKLNDSTEFVITYQNDDFIFVEGAVIQLQRKYIADDTFEVVEAPVTSDGGKAIVHIDLNSNIYQASVVKDGEVLDIFEGIVFSCENELSGQCEEKLEGNVNPNNDIPIETITDFAYTITTDDDNNTVTVLFAVPSGTPSSINVVLGQKDMFGNTTSCNTTVITSAGSITCSYDDTIDKSILELTVSKNGAELVISSYILDPELNMDGMNFFIVFLFLISLAGMSLASPEITMLIGIMTFMISGTMLLLKGMSLVMGLGAIAWLVVAVIIIIIKMAKQEDR